MLIAAGADLDHKDVTGETPMMTAAGSHRWHILYNLLKAGASQTVTDDLGHTVVHQIILSTRNRAVKRETDWYEKAIAILKEKGVDIEKERKKFEARNCGSQGEERKTGEV